jgi:hypothetical protein
LLGGEAPLSPPDPARRVTCRTAVIRGAAVALVIGVAFVGANVRAQSVPSGAPRPEDVPYVRLYDMPRDRFEVIINQGDGQAFAALARDPTLSRPDVFRGGRAEAAYRAQRPLLGWLVWATSLGNPDAVPELLVAWAVIGFVCLAAAATAFACWTRRSPARALAVLLIPGALITLDWTGPEALGAAAAITGVGLWRRERPPLAIVAALFVAAGLCRETMLVLPLALAVSELVARRGTIRRWLALLAAPVTFAAWVLVVHSRLDAWPTDARRGRLSLPLAGLLDAAPGWRAVDIGCAVVGLALVVAALLRQRRSEESWLVAAHLPLALCLGAAVWAQFEDFSRVLLPLYALAVLAILPADATRPGQASNIRSPGCGNL